MRIEILGRRYRLRRANLKNALGKCDPPDAKGKAITVKSSLSGELELDTLIHEMMHACNWNSAEEYVDQAATDIARVLWKLGYRKVDNKKD